MEHVRLWGILLPSIFYQVWFTKKNWINVEVLIVWFDRKLFENWRVDFSMKELEINSLMLILSAITWQSWRNRSYQKRIKKMSIYLLLNTCSNNHKLLFAFQGSMIKFIICRLISSMFMNHNCLLYFSTRLFQFVNYLLAILSICSLSTFTTSCFVAETILTKHKSHQLHKRSINNN